MDERQTHDGPNRPDIFRGPIRGVEGSHPIFDEAQLDTDGIAIDLDGLTATVMNTSTSIGRAILVIAWTVAVVVVLVAPAAVVAGWKALL